MNVRPPAPKAGVKAYDARHLRSNVYKSRMNKLELTQVVIEGLQSGTIWDKVVPGLGVRSNKNSSSYIFRKKGETNPITISITSNMTLVEARNRAVILGAEKMIDSLTFEDLALEWGENWGQFYRRRYKIEDVRRLDKYILPSIGGRLATSLRGRDLIQLHNRISLKGKIEANRCISLVSAIFNKSIEWELFVGNNPCTSVRRHSESGRSRVADKDELTRLLEILKKHPLGTFFLLNLRCGLRRGEVAKLRWEDINFGGMTILIRAPKNGKDHTVNIGPELITRLKSEKNNSPWVFPSPITGGHIQRVCKTWKTILKDANIESLTVHDLRRTFATKLIEAGVPIEHVSKALNHSSISITQDYVHINKNVVADVFKKAQQIF